MGCSVGLLRNKKMLDIVIDLFRDGSELTAVDVANSIDNDALSIGEGRANRILIMLYKQGVLRRKFNDDLRRYQYHLTGLSALFDVEI
jgi:hypothetical protein